MWQKLTSMQALDRKNNKWVIERYKESIQYMGRRANFIDRFNCASELSKIFKFNDNSIKAPTKLWRI